MLRGVGGRGGECVGEEGDDILVFSMCFFCFCQLVEELLLIAYTEIRNLKNSRLNISLTA